MTEVRVDKWLWAARFFKTRSLAAEAVDGGKVHLNGQRVKAGRPLRAGDRLEVRRKQEVFEVVVTALSDQRGPAPVAHSMYEETEESLARRQAAAEQRLMLAAAMPRFEGRPDKKARRAMVRAKRNGF